MKTKVISFRVSLEEYEGMLFSSGTRRMTLSDYVIACLRQDLDLSTQAWQKEQKRLEAKAKRDAKKAAANGAQ
jgi:hypothetical protein